MINLQYEIKIGQKIYNRVTSTENVWYEIACIRRYMVSCLTRAKNIELNLPFLEPMRIQNVINLRGAVIKRILVNQIQQMLVVFQVIFLIN